ncbi:hypothetical protein HK104_006540, partial [Borealophlyctis nickersoniae]
WERDLQIWRKIRQSSLEGRQLTLTLDDDLRALKMGQQLTECANCILKAGGGRLGIDDIGQPGNPGVGRIEKPF